MTDTKILCVIGHPVLHSMSPIMHNAALQDLNLNLIYLSFDIPPEKLKKAILSFRILEIKGINVTIPHKEAVIKLLDEVDQLTQVIGAVNTIKNENGYLKGKNTDALGSKKALLDADCSIKGKKVLILGAGGASRAVSFILAHEAESLVIANRTERRAKKLAKDLLKVSNANIQGTSNLKSVLRKEINKAHILVNTTPIGTFPLVNESPISKDLLHENLFVFDLVYNPLETKLIKDAREFGCETLGGIDMFVNQGALAFEWWTNKKPNLELMKNKVIENLKM